MSTLHVHTEEIMAFIDGEHFRYRRFAPEGPAPDEVALGGDWELALETAVTPLLEQMEKDFRRFCRRCMEITFAPGPACGQKRIRWVLTERRFDQDIDPQDRQVEAFTLMVGTDEVRLEARHERGLLHGTHYLERLMADRGGPWLKPGRRQRAPSFSPRISNGMFTDSAQKAEDPGKYSDDYLALMSHFGVNGLLLCANLWDLCRNSALPELNNPLFEWRAAALDSFAERTRRFGIDLYLIFTAPAQADRHPVFQAHPEVRGSRVDIFLEEFENREIYNLCSSQERVLQCYSEAMENLFAAAPRVAGAFLEVGGEAFYHCFSRPSPSADGLTNCPNCWRLDPSQEVARLVNRMAAAIKRTGRHKSVYAWPYSAFVWSGADRAQLRWIDNLSEEVSFISNFDTGQPDRINGDGVMLFDYNIKLVGPSEVFSAQAQKLQEKKRRVFCKTESNTTPDAFFLPYLPLHFRWHGRFAAMQQAGVDGYVGQWRFFGMNGSPPEELQYHVTWNPEKDADSLLRQMARRDFELPEEAARRATAAWRKLSAAWDTLPYSAMISGEREAYMRGPFYLGPAHPLIFNPQNSYHLGHKFRLLRGDLAEGLDPAVIEELQRTGKPRYVSDLMLTVPFGVERCLQLLGQCRRQWQAGLDELRLVLKSSPARRAQMELDVCDTIAIHLATIENVIRFYQARDRLWQERSDLALFQRQVGDISETVRAEIANAEQILPILARDFRIGYGHCYGAVYDEEMVRDKLRQCQYVLQQEIPRISAVVRFHLWYDFP